MKFTVTSVYNFLEKKVKKHHKIMAFVVFLAYIFLAYYLHFIRYKQKVGAVTGWFVINQRPLFWILLVAGCCHFLMVLTLFLYDFNPQFLKIMCLFLGGLYAISFVLLLIEKLFKHDILPDRLNNIIENLFFTPILFILFFIASQIHQQKK